MLFTASSDPDRVLDFLRIKMEPSSDKTRIGALAILRHLINSSGNCFLTPMIRIDHPVCDQECI